MKNPIKIFGVSGAISVLALVWTVAPAGASDEAEQTSREVFNLEPALVATVSQVLLDSTGGASHADVPSRPAPRLSVPLTVATVVSAETTEDTEVEEEKLRPGNWLVGGFNRPSRWVTGGLVLGLGAYLGFADEEDIRDVGDITQLLPAVTALGLTVGVKDWQGLKQYAFAGGTALVATHGMKALVEKSRPDDSATNSFPSGHTSASVTGAAFIWRRYGAKWGAPASVLAAYTGISRVVGEKHFMDDVISGAAIGLMSNWLFTHPIDDRVQMALFPTKGGAGVSVGVNPSAPKEGQTDLTDYGSIPRRMFWWEIAYADVHRNDVVSPNPGGTPIDWRFDGENNPTTTAFVDLSWATINHKHNFYLNFAPFEVREVFEVEQDIEYSRQLIEAGTEVQSRYVANDYRLGYGYAVLNKPRFVLTLGGAAAVFDTFLSLTGEEGVVSEGQVVVRPQIGASFTWVMFRRWLLYSDFYGWADSTVEIQDWTVQLGYQIHPKWGMSLGYRRVDRLIDTEDLFNEADRNQIALGIWYMW